MALAEYRLRVQRTAEFRHNVAELQQQEQAVREALALTKVVLGPLPPMKLKRPTYMELSDSERCEANKLLNSNNLLKSLRDKTWLNDEVINSYLELLNSKSVFCWNSFFWLKLAGNGYQYNAVRKWSTKRGIDVFSLDRMLVPMNIGQTHWALGMVDFKNKRIAYYDSLAANTVHAGFVECITRYMQDEFKDKKQRTMDDKFSTVAVSPPQQANSFDCGVFTCMTAECLAAGRDWLDFDQSMIPDMRRKMAVQIGHNSLSNTNQHYG